MTTNQTVDGVPGLRSLIERVTSQDLGMSAKKDRAEAAHELRALLDAPAAEERGSSHGFEQSPNTCRHDERSGVWWREGSITRTGRECCACGSVEEDPIGPAAQPQGEPVAILSGPDDSVCWTQDNTPKALRKQVVLIEHSDFLRLQELAYGAAGRVYQTRWNRLGEWEEWKTVSLEQYQRSEGMLFERRIIYAEQPAPVALAQIAGFNVVEDSSIPPGQIRMCNCNQGRLPCTCKPTAYDGLDNGTD
ncbi:MAG: hypothetical protein Q7T99_15475 [Pseudomonas sp.]|nr:hypothetical protein [Pseudomonas sp.]